VDDGRHITSAEARLELKRSSATASFRSLVFRQITIRRLVRRQGAGSTSCSTMRSCTVSTVAVDLAVTMVASAQTRQEKPQAIQILTEHAAPVRRARHLNLRRTFGRPATI